MLDVTHEKLSSPSGSFNPDDGLSQTPQQWVFQRGIRRFKKPATHKVHLKSGLLSASSPLISSLRKPLQSIYIMAVPDVTYGFIGIGQMGWGMAMNLRKKVPKTSNLLICELSESRRAQFVEEASSHGTIAVINSPKEVSEKAVSGDTSAA